jgi:hypothetical protein
LTVIIKFNEKQKPYAQNLVFLCVAARKTLFRQHRQMIASLTSRRVGLASKRRILEQRGGAFWIPSLIGAAISGLGSIFFGGNKQ